MDSKACIQQFKIDFQFRIAPKTLKGYLHFVNHLLKYSSKEIQDISKRDIRNWLHHLEEIGLKPITRRTYVMGLKTFFRYCLEEGYITKNPMDGIRPLNVEDLPPKSLTKEQVTLLRNQTEGKLIDRTLIEVFYATGVRTSELAKMKKSDIHWEERSILISEGKGKKGRVVLFTLECAEYLKAYLNSRKDDLPYLFVNPYATRGIAPPTIRWMFQQYSKQLGFEVTALRLRHTFASHLIQRGMPLESIQALLGHDTPQVTRHYAKLYGHEQKELYDEWM